MTACKPTGIRILARTILLPLMLGLGGCLVIPVEPFSKPPWPEPDRQKLLQEHADRDTVRRTLGAPTAVKSAGKYWIYTSKRTAFGIIGGTSATAIDDYEWLLVEFDAGDRIRYLEFNDDSNGCLSNGICFLTGFLDPHPVLTAPAADNTAALDWQPGPGTCAVYLLLEQLPWYYSRLPLRFSVDGHVQGYVNDKTYLFLPHAAGTVLVSAYQFTITVPCPDGGRVYVQAVKALDASWENGADLAPVQPATGDAVIRARRLALPD